MSTLSFQLHGRGCLFLLNVFVVSWHRQARTAQAGRQAGMPNKVIKRTIKQASQEVNLLFEKGTLEHISKLKLNLKGRRYVLEANKQTNHASSAFKSPP